MRDDLDRQIEAFGGDHEKVMAFLEHEYRREVAILKVEKICYIKNVLHRRGVPLEILLETHANAVAIQRVIDTAYDEPSPAMMAWAAQEYARWQQEG